MANAMISDLAAVLAADLDDTALLEVEDNDAHSRKATLAQLWTALASVARTFAAGITGTTAVFSGPVTAGTAGAVCENMGGAAAAATTVTRLVKLVTAIADAAATAVLTVTVPNAAHAASVRVRLSGSLGTGGAIGAYEATGTVAYDVTIVRTAGVNAVATISAAYGSAMGNVAGAATITVTAAMSAVAGAVGAVNTFTVNVTITKGGGASAAHTCRVEAQVLNALAGGVTIS